MSSTSEPVGRSFESQRLAAAPFCHRSSRCSGSVALATACGGADDNPFATPYAPGSETVGDVTLTGNNAIVYGAGPDVSVIGGTVEVAKNNAKIRGVRIVGDVEGIDTVLVRDRFNGTDRLSAQNLVCSDVTRFDDANANHAVEDAEIKQAIDCTGADKAK